MGLATYFVEVSWNNSGSFNGTYDDITSFTRAMTFSRGRANEFTLPEIGFASFQLDNTDRRFSPENTSTPIGAGNLVPTRPIRVRATQSGSAFQLFTGYIRRLQPQPIVGDKTQCIIEAEDALRNIDRDATINVAMNQSITTTCAIGKILDDVPFPSASRSFEASLDTLPYWWIAAKNARNAINEVAKSEWGLFFINGSGLGVFQNRNHRISSSTATGTFQNVFSDFRYDFNDQQLYNHVTVIAHPRSISASTTVWSMTDKPSMQANASADFWAQYTNPVTFAYAPALSSVAPAASTDYYLNAASDNSAKDGTSSASITFTDFNETAKIHIKNGASQMYVTKLQVRGFPLYTPNPTKAISSNASSITAYFKNAFELDLPWQQNSLTAQDFSDYLLGLYGDPYSVVGFTYHANRSAALMYQALSQEIGGRVTVSETVTGIAGRDYWIGQMQHTIDLAGTNHVVTYKLEKANTLSYWIIGTAQLGTGTRLAY